MIDRRRWLQGGLAAAGILVAHRAFAEDEDGAPDAEPMPLTQGRAIAGASYTPVVMPNGSTLPFTTRDGVKVFHLVAGPVKHTVAPGLDLECWGYNGTTPGPLIEAVEGDRVRFYVTNQLPEPTTVHWHGVFVPSGMDGVAGLNQPPIPTGKTFRYDFTFDRAGTFMYHPHFDEMTQIALGLVGMIVVHPRKKPKQPVRDYALMAHEWKVPIGMRRPDPMAMNDFNVLVFNGKAFPATEPLVAEVGDRVRIRLGNLGPMDHHPIHLHGYAFEVTATDGGAVPASARHPDTTVIVPVGSVRVIELVAERAGDWALHCHMTHHVMNQMGHDTPNMIGVDRKGLDKQIGTLVPGYMTMGPGHAMDMRQPDNAISMLGGEGPHGAIDMGGMFTVLKVRDQIRGDVDPGWYEAPAGTTAAEATAAELAADGIMIEESP